MPNGTESHSPPIAQIVLRIVRVVRPLHVFVRYRSESEAILTLPTYTTKTGELRVLRLGPKDNRGWRIKIGGEFKRYHKGIRKVVRELEESENRKEECHEKGG